MLLIAQGKQVGWMDILGAGLDLSGPLGKIAGRFGGMLFTYASKGSAIKFGRHGDDYIRGIGKACNCFVAGTPVDTPGGSVPIEELDVGDAVLTRPEGCPECPPQTGQVALVLRRIAPAILWLTLATGEVVGTTPGHEVWTFQRGWGPAAELAAGESFLTPAGAAATIVDVVLDPTPTPVYNFEVRGTHTYFAAGVWVHNTSHCRPFAAGAFSLWNVRKLPDTDLLRKPPRRGCAPIGRDNKIVNIHHVDQSTGGPFEEILASDHWKIRNDLAGLSAEERRLFDEARERYWAHQWDIGRFNHLPR